MTTHARLARARGLLGGTLAWSAGILLVAMTVLVLVQVFTRYVLGAPTAFTEEVVRYLLIWTSLLSASYAFVHRKHMALFMVRDRLAPRARQGVTVGADVLVLLFAVLVLGVGGVMLAIGARNDYSALLGISRGLVYLIVPLSGLAITAAQAMNLWEDLTGSETEHVSEPPAETEGS
ncbi:TRAP transporter small permease [Isoptericola sp. BMS4]|uniref:TRAP transporter small permease n=1 Tax=Isoptericola sp. BMS4 TaxID=2527875 RepID=UPI00141F393D|nr:TRAP transporter small permease [Isoptericola sp. BMS4]